MLGVAPGTGLRSPPAWLAQAGLAGDDSGMLSEDWQWSGNGGEAAAHVAVSSSSLHAES